MMVKKEDPTSSRTGCGCVLAVLFAAAVCAFVLLISTKWILGGVGSLLITSDPLEAADAAVILGGGDSTRIDEAVLLYEEKWMDFVILTETGHSVPEWDTDYTNLMRFTAIRKGIPANAILISKQEADSTAEEARTVRKFINQRGFDSLIVITDPYHTFRTRLIYADVFPEDNYRIVIHPVRDHWYQSGNWWFKPEGWKMTLLELIKLSGYLLGLQR